MYVTRCTQKLLLRQYNRKKSYLPSLVMGITQDSQNKRPGKVTTGLPETNLTFYEKKTSSHKSRGTGRENKKKYM